MTEVTILDYATTVARRISKSASSSKVSADTVREVVCTVGELVASDLKIYPAAIYSRTPRDATRSIREVIGLAAVYGAVVDRLGVKRSLYHCSFDNSCFSSFEEWRDLCIDFQVSYIAQESDGNYHHFGIADDLVVTQHDPRNGLPSYRCGNSPRPGLLGKAGASFASPAKRDRFFREFLTRAEYVKGFDGSRRSFV